MYLIQGAIWLCYSIVSYRRDPYDPVGSVSVKVRAKDKKHSKYFKQRGLDAGYLFHM